MPAVPVRQRVVEVEADLGEDMSPRWRYGSGVLLGRRQLLTAAHVVAGAKAVTVRDAQGVRRAARLSSALVGDPHGLDLALVEVPTAEELPEVDVAVVNRDVSTGSEVVEACWAVGYPAFAEVHRDGAGRSLRESVQVRGFIPPLTGLKEGLLSLQVTATPRPLPSGTLDRSEWSGMSGAAVFSGTHLLGVIAAHAPRRGPSDLTVTPLDRLRRPGVAPSDVSAWWARLGVTDPARVAALPAGVSPRPEPAYRATLRVIRERTKVLVGRQEELERIAAFAVGELSPFGPGTGARGYLWLAGGPWAGKTALLAEAVHALPREVDVVAFFLSARESRASQEHFLSAVVPQLAFLLDEDPPASLNADSFRALWERAAARAEGQDRHLLLVVDGLDEDLGPAGASVAALLPERLGPTARVLVSSRPYPGMPERVELPYDVVPSHPLRAAAAEGVRLSDSPQAVELRDLADQEIAALLAPLAAGPEADLAFDVLGLLTAAAGALAVDDVAALTARPPHVIRSFLTARASRSLEGVGPPARRRFQFAHQTLLERCRAHPDVGHRRYWDLLTAWGDDWASRRWALTDDGASVPRYLLDTYPTVLTGDPTTGGGGAGPTKQAAIRSQRPVGPAEHDAPPRGAKDLDRLARLVADAAWVDSAVAAAGIDHVLAVMRTAMRLCGSRREVAAMVRLVELQAHRLRPPRPTGRPGYAVTQLALEALRVGLSDVAARAVERLSSCAGTVLVPEWSTERTGSGLIRTLGHHDVWVGAVAVTTDGRAVSGGHDGTLLVWDLSAPGSPSRGHNGTGVLALAVTADARVVTGGHDGTVRLWDPATPSVPSRELGHHGGSVRAVTVSTDGRVVSGGEDGAVRVWDPAAPGAPGEALGHHQGKVLAVAVAPDGRVVSSSDDGTVRLWDLAAPGAPGGEVGHLESRVLALAVAAGGRVVSGALDGSVRLWDPVAPGDPSRELGRHGAYVRALVVTTDGRVMSLGMDGAVWLWDPAVPNDPGHQLWRNLDEMVWSVAATADGRVVSGGVDGAVRLWDPAAAHEVDDGPHPHPMGIRALAPTADGRALSCGDDGLWLWDPRASGTSRRLVDPSSWAQVLATAGDGRVVLGGVDGEVRLWDPADGDYPGLELGRHDDAVSALAATSDGYVLSGGRDGTVMLWNSADPENSGRQVGRHEDAVTALAATPDGRVLSGGRDGTVMLWDCSLPGDGGRVVGRHRAGALFRHAVLAVTATADGRVLSGADDGTVRLWDPSASDGSSRELGRHGSWLQAVAASRDGWLISGADDGTVRLWDPAGDDGPGRELCCHESAVEAMATAGASVIVATDRGLSGFRMSMEQAARRRHG